MIDVTQKVTYCTYPFIKDPIVFLKSKWNGETDNYRLALQVLNSQRRKSADVKSGLINFHNEILGLGFAMKLDDLPKEMIDQIFNAELRHYFIWRSIAKPGSLSTPYRVVVDATQTFFNDCLAKGINCLSSLFHIIITWRSYLHTFTFDVSKMFNSVKLYPSEYKYSLYLFSPTLDLQEEPITYVMTTLFYGLRSSANQCTHTLREIGSLKKEEFPHAADVLQNTTYMDDGTGGANDRHTLNTMIEELKTVLPLAGFRIKMVCTSGDEPPEPASSDGISTSFAGVKWDTKEDMIGLNTGEINFHAKRRGVKKPNEFPVVSDDDVDRLLSKQKLTRRNLLGKCLEVYDLTGIFEPLKARLKLDLQPLKHLDYDEEIPLDIMDRWKDNLKLINNAKFLRVKRTIIPQDAVNPNEIHLLACSDASTNMAGVAVYARLQLKD